MFYGLLDLPWWGNIVAVLLLTHITIISVTVYLHRCQAHRALELHPAVSHFFRFWLWLTTGMTTRAWASIHRKHHAKCETEEDPHSPVLMGLRKVLFHGAELYRKEAKNPETLEKYGQGTPNDAIERFYSEHSSFGLKIAFVLSVLLFGIPGISIWAIQMAWIPFFAAGVINGVGHYFGYRNFECPDAATNIVPFGFLIGGEELHNNHHTFGTSAKFSVKWWEIDLGWGYIKLLSWLKLAKIRRLPPSFHIEAGKSGIDIDTIKAIVTNRFQVMARYSRKVILPVYREEKQKAPISRRVKTLLIREPSLVDAAAKQQLEHALNRHQRLSVVYQFGDKLRAIWARTTATPKELIEALQEWCKQAEASGINALDEFSQNLKGIKSV